MDSLILSLLFLSLSLLFLLPSHLFVFDLRRYPRTKKASWPHHPPIEFIQEAGEVGGQQLSCS